MFFITGSAAAGLGIHYAYERGKAVERAERDELKAQIMAEYLKQQRKVQASNTSTETTILPIDRARAPVKQTSYNDRNYQPKQPITYTAPTYRESARSEPVPQPSQVTVVGRLNEAEHACELVTKKGSIERRECIMRYNLNARNKGSRGVE
jgi:hypothetical protein